MGSGYGQWVGMGSEYGQWVCRVSYRIFVWEGEIFFKDGKPKLNHALNA